ncbi:MAG: metallophosphatase [Desulfobulbus propionicus]|nr:MAG: metallophosphatase [Desulfobulbus propionicus]
MPRTIIIGDIHGCLKSLNDLLEKIFTLATKTDTVLFLGDYVDRGPDAKGVLDCLIALKKEHSRLVTLKGNHDFLFLRYLETQESDLFFQVGGLETLHSYGVQGQSASPIHDIPESHLHFLQELPLVFEDQYGIYVHAGIQAGRHLSMQSPKWCLWARESFLKTTFTLDKPIIFGHTVFQEPYVAQDKIGIDTGAVYGGLLTALILPDMKFIQVPGEQNSPYRND